MSRLLLILLIMCNSILASAQHLTFMQLNCENAFDVRHDDGKNDYEYIEGGQRNWNNGRLYRKLDGIARIVAAVDTVQPVGVIGLCEVENDSVLEYLTKRTVLRNLDYDYFVTRSADLRGIDVALVYSRLVFSPVSVQSLRAEGIDRPTRDILHVTGIALGDTMDLYVVHFPSKLGGRVGRERALKVARLLKTNVDSILAARSTAKIVVMGDFNAELKSDVFTQGLSAGKYWATVEKEYVDPGILYDVIEEKAGKSFGTYKYKGAWSVIDHILVLGRVNVIDSGILSNSQVLEDDDKYGGKKPRRTFVGYKYNGGISDHLPIWVKIRP